MYRWYGGNVARIVPEGVLCRAVVCGAVPADIRLCCWRTSARTCPCRLAGRLSNMARARSTALALGGQPAGDQAGLEGRPTVKFPTACLQSSQHPAESNPIGR